MAIVQSLKQDGWHQIDEAAVEEFLSGQKSQSGALSVKQLRELLLSVCCWVFFGTNHYDFFRRI